MRQGRASALLIVPVFSVRAYPGIPHAVADSLAYQWYQTQPMRNEFVWQGTAILVVGYLIDS